MPLRILGAAALLAALSACTTQPRSSGGDGVNYARTSGVSCDHLTIQQGRRINGQRYGCFDIPTPGERAQEDPGNRTP
jgi:hypothetical protein